MAASAAPILLVGNFHLLLLLLLIYGAATAANDVAANAQASHLERLSGRAVTGSLHASFSAGGLVGATVTSAWATSTLPPAASLACIAALVGVTIFMGTGALLDEPESGHASGQADRHISIDQLPAVRRRLRIFGALAFMALVVEGAFYDWAAVYMRDVVHASASWIGVAYAAFSIGMAMGRLSGDRIRDRFRHQVVVAASGLVCLVGMLLMPVACRPEFVTATFWIAGIGLSNFIPILFSSAGRLARNAGVAASQGLAVTTRMAYFGLLAGPLAIGPLAQAIGLRMSMTVLAAVVGIATAGWLLLSALADQAPWDVKAGAERPVGKTCSLTQG
jgi:predicted MFS family arabinose efflux permease